MDGEQANLELGIQIFLCSQRREFRNKFIAFAQVNVSYRRQNLIKILRSSRFRWSHVDLAFWQGLLPKIHRRESQFLARRQSGA